MCNRYTNTIAYRDYVETLRQLGIAVVSPSPEAAPNLEPQTNIAPTNITPALRPVPGGVELCRLRWGLIPLFHKKGVKEWKALNTNARYETLATTRSFKRAYEKRRCLIPASSFFEWTGEKGKKTKWEFSRVDGEWFCFAGLWDRAETTDGVIESYALVTTAAGPDVAPYHDRQPVILERADYTAWINNAALPEQAAKPSSSGLLNVEKA